MKNITSLTSLNSGHHIFENHPATWALVSANVKIKNFVRDDSVICHGDTAHSLFIIMAGWVSLTRQTPDGKETIVGLLTKDGAFGEAALFPNASYPYNARVIDDKAQIMLIPSRVIREAIQNDKEFSASTMALLNERLSKTQLKLEHLSLLSAEQRIGCFLLNLCDDKAQGSKIIHIPIEKHIIAAYLGMKPETFSRSLHQLKEIGIKTSGTTVNVNSIEDLREFVCNSCSESGSCDTKMYTNL